MSGSNKHMLVPQLRFPEFRNAEEWTTYNLGQLSKIVTERVGNNDCIPYTITSGVGLISQQEKLGRTIAGNSLKNYILLQHNDFAYNKSATKAYPQGYIACYQGYERAAVPNSIFTCFRPTTNLVIPAFLDNLFIANLHGKWLKNRVAVGARANGALQVNNDDLMKVPVPLPIGSQSLSEQKKIADCLSSLDDLLTAEVQKLDALKKYKKGLLQQLFPREGETVPRMRFPEFLSRGAWLPKSIGDSCQTFSGGTPSSTNKVYYGGEIPFIRSAEIKKYETELYLTKKGLENSAAKMVKKGDVLVALYGANSGEVSLSKIDGAINQAILCLRHESNNAFLYQYLMHKKEWIITTFLQGGQGNLSGEIIKSIKLFFPQPPEQQKIADFLLVFDDQIDIQTGKIDILRKHKKGLVQQLIPVVNEVTA